MWVLCPAAIQKGAEKWAWIWLWSCWSPGWGRRDPLILSGQVGRGCQVSGACWPSESTNREERKDLSLGPGLSKINFQDLTAKLLLGLKWIKPEALEDLESPFSMEENAHYNYSLVHCRQRVIKGTEWSSCSRKQVFGVLVISLWSLYEPRVNLGRN